MAEYGSQPLTIGVRYFFKTEEEAKGWREHWTKKGYEVQGPVPMAGVAYYCCVPRSKP